MYNCPGIAFNGASSGGFSSDLARNVVSYDFDNSSSIYTDNRKNNFLVLGEGATDVINDSVGTTQNNI